MLNVNPLGAISIYIYAHVCLLLTAISIYICTQYKEAPTEQSFKARNECGVNPCLLSSNKFRPHLSTYITTRKRQEGAVLMCEWSWILTRLPKAKLFLEQTEQTASSFYLRHKYYHQITWKWDETVKAIGVLVSTSIATHSMASNKYKLLT